ncbi:MAG: hypothetical protein IPJ75_07180 [Ignavibacteriales bacterium]|nr:hypothetical protein [Ignavibacteriales bacterium]
MFLLVLCFFTYPQSPVKDTFQVKGTITLESNKKLTKDISIDKKRGVSTGIKGTLTTEGVIMSTQDGIEILKLLALIVGGVYGIRQFYRNNAIKAAEILNTLEQNFGQHIPILIDIEYPITYKKKILEAIKNVQNKCTNRYDDAVIIQLDKMFRHFHTCVQIAEKLRVDNSVLFEAYHFYLEMFLQGNRKEIARYTFEYWPSVYNWAVFAKMIKQDKKVLRSNKHKEKYNEDHPASSFKFKLHQKDHFEDHWTSTET